LGLAPLALPLTNIDFSTWPLVSYNAVNGTALTTPSMFIQLTTTATANSTIGRGGGSDFSLLNSNVGVGWQSPLAWTTTIIHSATTATAVYRMFLGKLIGGAFGAIASGNYVAVEIQNNTLINLIICTAGVVTIVPLTPTVVKALGTKLFVSIASGAVAVYADNILIGAGTGAPTTAQQGTIMFEATNGTNTDNCIMRLRSFLAY
jgi:hypothetical protein